MVADHQGGRHQGAVNSTSLAIEGGKAMDMAARRASRKAAWHLLPFLVLCFFIAFLDRVNVGFAALTMNKDLGLTAEMYGFGAGIFFFGYFIFEVPSNLILERVGARRWIARIMISWGVISAAFAFVPAISQTFQSAGASFFDKPFYIRRRRGGVLSGCRALSDLLVYG
jgi:MFS family permease